SRRWSASSSRPSACPWWRRCGKTPAWKRRPRETAPMSQLVLPVALERPESAPRSKPLAPPLRESTLGLDKDRVGDSGILVVGTNAVAAANTLPKLSALRWSACVLRQVFCEAQHSNSLIFNSLRKVHTSENRKLKRQALGFQVGDFVLKIFDVGEARSVETKEEEGEDFNKHHDRQPKHVGRHVTTPVATSKFCGKCNVRQYRRRSPGCNCTEYEVQITAPHQGSDLGLQAIKHAACRFSYSRRPPNRLRGRSVLFLQFALEVMCYFSSRF